MDRKMIVPGIVLGLATVALAAAYTSSASASWSDQRQAMADSLSQKLGIDKTQVSTALNQVQQENQAKRQEEQKAALSTQLDKAVADGVITAEQKQKLLDKQAELQAQREKERTELEQWYTDNGIDTSKLQQYHVGIGGPGMGGRGHRGMMGGDF